MVERPYQYVPTVALLILIKDYKMFVAAGDFKAKKDLDLMLNELDIRFTYNKQDDRQITIEEYIRSRKNECDR